jgi:hypothetical protein
MASLRCASCRAKLELGRDVLAVFRGVIGPRGFIPLEDPALVCSEPCLAEYAAPPMQGPHRVP